MTTLLILSLIFPDFDDNGVVDFADFLLFVTHFNSKEKAYDLDDDGVVGFSDFLIFTAHFGKRHPSVAFNISLKIVDEPYSFTEKEKGLIRAAARRWKRLLLAIYRVEVLDMRAGVTAFGGPTYYPDQKFPNLGVVWISRQKIESWRADHAHRAHWDNVFYEVVLHEMAHVFGFGLLWDNFVPHFLVHGDDPHFAGPLARQAFNQAGGTTYTGKKVPLQNIEGTAGTHWRGSVFGDELMTSRATGNRKNISAITVQTFADYGYIVDVSKADPYTLPE